MTTEAEIPAPSRGMRAVDLFCGVGGLSAGLANAGIEVVAAYDNWSRAVTTYNRNLRDHAMVLDLRNVVEAVREINRHAPDLIVGGPPCQDFSTAGHRVEGRHANLTLAFAEVVAACKPRFVLMENVPQARLSRAYATMRSMLEPEYVFGETLLDASRCGVPQARKRFFSLGTLQEKGVVDAFVACADELTSRYRLTVKEYLGDDIDVEYYYRHPA